MAEIVVRSEVKKATPFGQTMPEAKGKLIFDPQCCRTCRVCEVVCAIGKEGQARPAVARINITYNEFERVNPIAAQLCAQCEDAPCMDACRVGAMTRDARTGAVVILQEKCVGCMRCAKACPWRVPKQHPDRKKALKCDLCSERVEGPLCLEFCPLKGKALRYEPEYYLKEHGNGHV